MANFASPSIDTIARRFANWTRIVGVSLAVVALMALSFTLGRTTIGHARPTATVVQPAEPPTGGAEYRCRTHQRC